MQAAAEAAFRQAGLLALLPEPCRARLQQVTGLLRAVRARMSECTTGLAHGSPMAAFHASWQSQRVTLVRLRRVS